MIAKGVCETEVAVQHSRSLRSCELCGKRIPPERLRLLPGTRRCVRCSEERPKTIDQVPVDETDLRERIASAEGTTFRNPRDWS